MNRSFYILSSGIGIGVLGALGISLGMAWHSSESSAVPITVVPKTVVIKSLQLATFSISVEFDIKDSSNDGYGQPKISIQNKTSSFRFNPPVASLAYCDGPEELRVKIEPLGTDRVSVTLARNEGPASILEISKEGLISIKGQSN